MAVHRQVWVMADLPHAMKNLRNHILDKGVTTSDGGHVNKQLIAELLAIDGGAELRVLHKLHATTHLEASDDSSWCKI